MTEVLFWMTTLLLIYPYVIYPLILRVACRWWPAPDEVPAGETPLPSVMVIISAHNEAAIIEEKIATTMAADYPHELLGVTVVSDASTDETNIIVARMASRDPRIRLLALEQHRGKTAGLNIAMEEVTSDIVIFTDANAIFDVTAIRTLVSSFASPQVGYAVGAALYDRNRDTDAGRDEGLYWRYELAIKQQESQFESVVGGDGAIYAIRRELYRTLAAEDINDFVNPLQIIAQGYRGVFRADARAYEDPANDYGKEFKRKRRIVCRSWGGLLRYFRRLELTRFPRFLFMLISHKVIRWFTLLWASLAFICNVVLVAHGHGGLYVWSLLGFLSTFALGALGRKRAVLGAEMGALYSLPYYFYLSNLAAILGIFDYLRGNRYVTWEHARINGQS